MSSLSSAEQNHLSPAVRAAPSGRQVLPGAPAEVMITSIARSFFGVPLALFGADGEPLLTGGEMVRLTAACGLCRNRLHEIWLDLANRQRRSILERPCSEVSIRRAGRLSRLKFLLERIRYADEYLYVLLLIGCPGLFLPFGMSTRELEVVLAIRGGLSNREIGESLYISVETVKRHISNIFRKTESRNRADLLFRLQQFLFSRA